MVERFLFDGIKVQGADLGVIDRDQLTADDLSATANPDSTLVQPTVYRANIAFDAISNSMLVRNLDFSQWFCLKNF